MAYEGMIAETVSIKGNNGEPISAYVARPLGSGPFPGMVKAGLRLGDSHAGNQQQQGSE